MCLAVPGRVVGVERARRHPDGRGRLRRRPQGRLPEYVPTWAVGDYVIVHVGFAIQRLDEASALETLASSTAWASWRRSSATGSRGRPGRRRRMRDEVPRRVQRPRPGRRLLDQIHAVTTRPWAIMEVCGGQTHSIIRHGIDQLLPDGIEMIHGPGCPVCVTPLEMIDKALAIAARPGRDLLLVRRHAPRARQREGPVPVKSEGGDVRVVYSPLDALKLARENPDRRWCSSASASRRPRRPTR